MGPTSLKKRFIVFALFTLIFIILIPVVILYSIGYRLGKDLALTPTGGIYVYHPQSGMSVSVKDLTPQTTSLFSRSVLLQNLKPTYYEINAWKTGYSYWKKNILVKEQQVAEAYPFFVLEPVATSTLATSTKLSVEKLFLATSTALNQGVILNNLGVGSTTASSTALRKKGILERNVFLYSDDSTGSKELIALWNGKINAIPFFFCGDITGTCKDSILVVTSQSKIKHFSFYPGRYDVVIYSNSDGVFMTELDKREPQNFVTLAKGKVDFRLQNGHIYIKDTTLGAGKSILYELLYE